MGSKTFDGVRFSIYTADHHPPHVHGTTEGVIVVIELLADGGVGIADRKDAIQPRNAKRSVVAKISRAANKNVDELRSLWEKTHGAR